MVTCELCGKQVKTAQALRGHKTFIHGITGSNTQQPVARLATEQQVSLLEDRLQQLERVTGLRESDSDFSLNDAEPLTDRLTSVAEQVTKLTDAVSKLSETVSELSEDVELAKADNVMIGELNHKLMLAHDHLAGVVNKHCDASSKNFEVHRSRIYEVQKLIEGLAEGLNEIRTKLSTHGHDGLSQIPQLSGRLLQVGEEIAGLHGGVAKAQALAVRTPTDDFERLELASGSTHAFRVYKGKRGLSNPHRVSIDLFSADKYVDLAEPED